MDTKTRELKMCPSFLWEVKQEDADQGIVEHLISVYGVEDLGQDTCHQGAFTKTLKERKGNVRVLDMHRRASTADALGVPLDIWEVGREELPPEVLDMFPEATGGVKARTQFLLETPEGKGAYIRLKTGAVKEWSFAYAALDFDYTTKKSGGRTRNLRTIKLYEYGPTLFGMMPGARTISAKTEGEAEEESGASRGAEEKVVDVTENTIQIRVRPSEDFQEDSFRTIKVDEGKGIQARIGRLEGETSTTIQAYLFDKEKWTKERAVKWVEDHKKFLIIFISEEKADDPDTETGGPTACLCPKCGHKVDKERGTPCRTMECPKCGTKLVADDEDEGGKSDDVQLSLKLLEIEQAQLELVLEGAGPAD